MSNLQQRTLAWHEARQGKLTASNVGAALGLCPWTSRNQAFNRAMGTDKFCGKHFTSHIGSPTRSPFLSCILGAGNDATRWGTNNEANGILAYTAHTGNLVWDTGLHVHPHYPWLAGSPDGLIGSDGLLEVKCPFYHKKGCSRLHQTIPSHYYMQMQLCLECSEREWCDFITWSPEGYKIYRLTRDRDLNAAMLPHYIEFYAAMQRQATKPPPMSKETKEAIATAVEASMDEKICYRFWTQVDCSAPPPSPEDEED